MSETETEDLRRFKNDFDWPPDGTFRFTDSPGEHDPCFVIFPDGCMVPINHHNMPGVDIARANFIIDACNQAWATEKRK